VIRKRGTHIAFPAQAHAYAALIPAFGFQRFVTMLEQACDHGVESIPAAPPELVRFIAEMERLPTWLDMNLIEEGARIERNAYANRAPFVIRGALLATFMNKYSALPMALTGALRNEAAAHRVKETATFFTSTVMPGALKRHGAGFKNAAMVRLMHSMVRFNILRHGNRWDVGSYGVPIPQVDQMPAGILAGGGGDDLLEGGGDLLEGGMGNDSFVFTGDWGRDSIADFGEGDLILLDAGRYAQLESVLANAVEGIVTLTSVGRSEVTRGLHCVPIRNLQGACLLLPDVESVSPNHTIRIGVQ
jgi:hypothetical protein